MRYILNSAVITTPGRYQYELISTEKSIQWLQNGSFLSTIGYQETADALSALTGIQIDVNRKSIRMKTGDQALVFRLTARLNDPSLKGMISDKEWLLTNTEIGLLYKL